MKTEKIEGAESWVLHSDRVSAAVTREGGHLGPIQFVLSKGRTVAPMHCAPWATEKLAADTPAILKVLRGDFFCMPFGGNAAPFKKERHPVHGETANSQWQFVGSSLEDGTTRLDLAMETKIRPAKVQKSIFLRAGESVVYSRHVISGARGPMNCGHHAMLAFGNETGLVSVAPFGRGQVFPGEFEEPAAGGYSSLKRGARFRDLSRVPKADGGTADLTRFPDREGFEDLVMVSAKPGNTFGWTAAVFPESRFVWFSLKDPRVLASTVLWHSNGGRHYAPWSGRHRGVLGLEEVTSNFHYGLAESARPNPVSKEGIPTTISLDPKIPLAVNTILGIAEVPAGFGHVTSIAPVAGGIEIRQKAGKRAVFAPADTDFLYGDEGF